MRATLPRDLIRFDTRAYARSCVPGHGRFGEFARPMHAHTAFFARPIGVADTAGPLLDAFRIYARAYAVRHSTRPRAAYEIAAHTEWAAKNLDA